MIAETARDMVDALRLRLDDAVTPGASEADKLWKDAELFSYVNIACAEFADITENLRRVVTITVTANQPTVALPAYVLEIDNVTLVSTGARLCEYNSLSSGYGTEGMFAPSVSTPRRFSRDAGVGVLTLYPTPSADDAINVSCSITMREPLESDDDIPFQQIIDQRLLMVRAMAEAYMKQDAETYNPRRANELKNEFYAQANERTLVERRRRRQAGTVKMSGWD